MQASKPLAWKYRDFVIDAFNRDLPFDEFVREQLAGDEIEGMNSRTQIAANFLRLGPWENNATFSPDYSRGPSESSSDRPWGNNSTEEE